MGKSFLESLLIAIIITYFGIAPSEGAEPILIPNGISPNRKFATVAYDNFNWTTYDFSEPRNICLYDHIKRKNIKILLRQGDTGTTSRNVSSDFSANWSPDSRFVAITFRCGRMNHDIIVYRIESEMGVAGRNLKKTEKIKAIPQTLPFPQNSSIAEEIFANAEFHSNGGSYINKWIKNDEFSEILYHLIPKDFNKSLHPMINSNGDIEVIYKYQNGNWEIKKFNKFPD